jgi:hypothetical protein
VFQRVCSTSTAASASSRENCSVRGKGSWLALRGNVIGVQLGFADDGDAAGFTASMIVCAGDFCLDLCLRKTQLALTHLTGMRRSSTEKNNAVPQ